MTSAEEKREARRHEIESIKMDLNAQLFPAMPSKDSPLGSYPPDIPVRASEETLDKEHSLRSNVDTMFAMISELSTTEPKNVHAPAYYVEDQTTRSGNTTWTRTALEISSVQSSSRPRKQIFLSESASLETGNIEDDAHSRRKVIEARLALLRLELEKKSRSITTGRTVDEINADINAAEHAPFETLTIQLQDFEPDTRSITPLVGIKIQRSLAGVQAYPVIYQGREAYVLQNQILKPKLSASTELTDNPNSYFMPYDEFVRTPLSHTFQHLMQVADKANSARQLKRR